MTTGPLLGAGRVQTLGSRRWRRCRACSRGSWSSWGCGRCDRHHASRGLGSGAERLPDRLLGHPCVCADTPGPGGHGPGSPLRQRAVVLSPVWGGVPHPRSATRPPNVQRELASQQQGRQRRSTWGVGRRAGQGEVREGRGAPAGGCSLNSGRHLPSDVECPQELRTSTAWWGWICPFASYGTLKPHPRTLNFLETEEREEVRGPGWSPDLPGAGRPYASAPRRPHSTEHEACLPGRPRTHNLIGGHSLFQT